jgi:hypothetical protein
MSQSLEVAPKSGELSADADAAARSGTDLTPNERSPRARVGVVSGLPAKDPLADLPQAATMAVDMRSARRCRRSCEVMRVSHSPSLKRPGFSRGCWRLSTSPAIADAARTQTSPGLAASRRDRGRCITSTGCRNRVSEQSLCRDRPPMSAQIRQHSQPYG